VKEALSRRFPLYAHPESLLPPWILTEHYAEIPDAEMQIYMQMQTVDARYWIGNPGGWVVGVGWSSGVFLQRQLPTALQMEMIVPKNIVRERDQSLVSLIRTMGTWAGELLVLIRLNLDEVLSTEVDETAAHDQIFNPAPIPSPTGEL